MADLNFPTSPALNDTYSFNGKTWVWNGQGWQLQNQGAINGIIIGNSTPAAGTFTTLSATANVTGGNILTGGLVSATSTITSAANITGGNLLTGGLVSATGTITGSSHLGAVVSVTANITGGNLLSAAIVSAVANITGGNILTAGLVSATANITGGNILTAGLVSATGTVTGSSHLGAVVSVTANVTGGNILTVGQISATGNITGNYYIGNGAFLTGLSAGTADKIANGATNINIPVASGNIAMSVAGQANTVVINLGSLTMYGTFAGPKTLSANVSVADGVNGLLLGPVSIGAGYHIDVPATSTLYVYAP